MKLISRTIAGIILIAFGLTAKGETEQNEAAIAAIAARPSGQYKLIAHFPGPRIPVRDGWVLVGAEQAGAGVIQMYLFNTQSGRTAIWYTVIQ